MFLSEWCEFPSTPCLAGGWGGGKLITAHVSMLLKSRASLTCFRACFLPGRAKDLSAPRQNRDFAETIFFWLPLWKSHSRIIGFAIAVRIRSLVGALEIFCLPPQTLLSILVYKLSRCSNPISTVCFNVMIFTHSNGMCRMRRFLAVLRNFFHSSLLCNFSCHPSPRTVFSFSFTSSCHLFLGLLLNLVVPKFIYNVIILLGLN